MELRTEDGRAVGTVDVQRQGEDTVFAVTACLPHGLWRITACGRSGELSLGVTEGGAVHWCRRFSSALTRRLGAVESVTVQRAGARMESEWQACTCAPQHLPPLPAGTLCKTLHNGRMLAMPWSDNAPFPWTPLFCLARVGRMNGRLWVFYMLDSADRPVLPPKM